MDTQFNAVIMAAAAGYLGVREHPGRASNPAVEVFFARAGHPGLTDDVPWCAAFVGAVLAEVGLPGSGSLMARSYLRWGREVGMAEARPGDVVVLARGRGPQGHVGFLVRFEGDRVVLRGGNQSDAVSDAGHPAASILGIRRADPSVAGGRATLRPGDRGAMVLDVQDQLMRLRYFAGARDGVFGPLTREAVLAFQADHGLETDAVVGNRTWAALAAARPRAEREITAADLRERGSATVRSADTLDVVGAAAGITATATAVAEAAEGAEGALAVASRMVTQHWPLLLIALAALAVVVLAGRIRAARVADARSGAHLGR